MPGFDDSKETASGLLAQAGRADLVMWVASATQPARSPDRKRFDELRAWSNAQLSRRPPPVLLALSHVDELRPAMEWTPPYDISTPVTPKGRAIRAAANAAARAFDFPEDAIVPIAMRPGCETYNTDALWTKVAAELDVAKLVPPDRSRGTDIARTGGCTWPCRTNNYQEHSQSLTACAVQTKSPTEADSDCNPRKVAAGCMITCDGMALRYLCSRPSARITVGTPRQPSNRQCGAQSRLRM
jgi:hypothetical protein